LSEEKEEELLTEYSRCYREEDEAPSLYRELVDHPLPRQELLVLNRERYRSLGLVKYVLARAPELWHRAPHEAAAHARLALAISGRLPTEKYSPGLVADYGARACAYVANALRIQGDLRAADQAMQNAAEELERGTGDPTERARLLRLRTSLRKDQRRLKEAERDAREAVRLLRSVEDKQAEIEMVLLQSAIMTEEGAGMEALALVEKCLETLDPSSVDERLYFGVVQHFAWGLFEAGRSSHAERYLPELRDLVSGLDEPLSEARVDWLEALIDAQLGRKSRAVWRFLELLRLFQNFDMSLDAALVALDLAAVHLQAGEVAEARELAGELVAIFESLQVGRETMEALSVFAEALRQEAATAVMAEEAKSLLKARH